MRPIFSNDPAEEHQMQEETLGAARIIARSHTFPETPLFGDVPCIVANLLAMYKQAAEDRDRYLVAINAEMDRQGL